MPGVRHDAKLTDDLGEVITVASGAVWLIATCVPPPDKGLEFRNRAEMRLVSGAEVFNRAEPDGSGAFCGWVRHSDGADPDVISLLMFADVIRLRTMHRDDS